MAEPSLCVEPARSGRRIYVRATDGCLSTVVLLTLDQAITLRRELSAAIAKTMGEALVPTRRAADSRAGQEATPNQES